MNKKYITLAIAALLLTSCGSNEKETTSNEAQSTTKVETTSNQETVSEEKSSTETSDTQEDTKENAKANTGFDGKVYETDKFKIEITDYKVIPAGEPGNEYGDKPVIAFWYNTTNKTDEDLNPMDAWIFSFKAIQDNDPNTVNELNVGMLPDDQFLDTQTQQIKNGGTVANAMSYELLDLETPVTLKATDILGTEFGSADFEINN